MMFGRKKPDPKPPPPPEPDVDEDLITYLEAGPRKPPRDDLRSVFKRRLRAAFWENFHPIKPMPAEFEVLARYNAEVTRGIVHTPEWRAKMAELQEWFNEWAWSETERLGWISPEGPRERPDA